MKNMMICAASSGSGKTMIVCGLLELLKNRGFRPVAFKCGPDFIDPLFHRQVQGTAGTNLDSFFLPPQELRRLFAAVCREEEEKNPPAPGCETVAVAEGVMGYFDGMGGCTSQGSSWEIGRILGIPGIFVADARGAGLSVAAQIQGFLNYRPQGAKQADGNIRGVILNGVSPALYPLLKEKIQEELGVAVVGYVPKLSWLKVESRHLGLVLPGEIQDIRQQLERLGQVMEETIDLDLLLSLASCSEPKEAIPKAPVPAGRFDLAVAQDAAFCFYYQENLKALEAAGARLRFFSPLKDEKLPQGVDGVLLGGGYPELYARELWENASMRQSILQAAREGMPMLGECGGYLYLLEALESAADHKVYPMVGVFSGTGRREEKLRHFGYISLEQSQDGLYMKAGESVRGHEFHYWHCREDDALGQLRAKKPSGSRSWPAMREQYQVFAGFPHLYYPSLPGLAQAFGRACLEYQRTKEQKA